MRYLIGAIFVITMWCCIINAVFFEEPKTTANEAKATKVVEQSKTYATSLKYNARIYDIEGNVIDGLLKNSIVIVKQSANGFSLISYFDAWDDLRTGIVETYKLKEK